LIPFESVPDKVLKEVESIEGMSRIVDKEMLHYTKQIVRGWWQEQQEAKAKKRLKDEPGACTAPLNGFIHQALHQRNSFKIHANGSRRVVQR